MYPSLIADFKSAHSTVKRLSNPALKIHISAKQNLQGPREPLQKMAADDGFSYLMPGHSEKHRRAPNWTDGEMKALLYVWEEFHNELKMSKRNAKVYEKMSQRFFQLTGEQRFKEEIKMKITNMSFQYRRLKATAGESTELPDWPYYKPIEKILTKPVENGRVTSLELQSPTAGPSTSSQSTENILSQGEDGTMGFLPEYTGSSDEMEIKQELDSLSSDSDNTQGSRRKHSNRRLSMKRRKLQVMQAMLQQQKRSSRAVEETCREIRRAMQQQNLLQVQCLQLQERMMNLLEKMIQPPSTPSAAWAPSATKDSGKS
ncbi:myb/SANT-like DNA-binding domain-containing protein 1 isoform X2 [Cololabis saira]|uniref:myb/SANT-like DNA-binding domain-containing protein 1 isoform X2 n=1 Tax=Cololabis saira TaxID=129043 RepID=UPI002AD5006C|nr:myb/SANT-like DNA-binding domain-containing protein 1 isoform X2 [Cololabis saira]